jgi:hypothetical protein
VHIGDICRKINMQGANVGGKHKLNILNPGKVKGRGSRVWKRGGLSIGKGLLEKRNPLTVQ